MGRKDSLNYNVKQLIGNALTANVDNFNDPTEVQLMDNIGIILNWTGTPVGEFEIYVSNKEQKPSVAADYVKLDFGATIAINNAQSSHLIYINQIPYKWIAIKYVFTSGNGTLEAIMNNRMVGG